MSARDEPIAKLARKYWQSLGEPQPEDALNYVIEFGQQMAALQAEQDAPYMQHSDDCELRDTWTPQQRCTCGLAAIRAGVKG